MNKKIFIVAMIVLSVVGLVPIYNMRQVEVNAMTEEADVACGDGYLWQKYEECDDGNVENGDGCSLACKVEDLILPSHLCSDGIDNDDDGSIDVGDRGCHIDWDANNAASYDSSRDGECEIVRIGSAIGGTEGNDYSESPSVTADGRYVAFVSFASNLVPDDNNNDGDIFLYDRLKGETKRISVANDGTEANGLSIRPSISADGRYVAFMSFASNLVPNDNNGNSDIYIYDVQRDEIRRVSISSDGEGGNGFSAYPNISPDGNYVQFYSLAANLIGAGADFYGDYFVCDLRTGGITVVAALSVLGGEAKEYPLYSVTSTDGRYLAFASFDGIFVHGTSGDIYERVDVSSSGERANGISDKPSLSTDGRYVAFVSEANNLVSGDNNDDMDIFVHDRLTGKTSRISVG